MSRQICTMVENNSIKSKHLRELKENFNTYDYCGKNVEIGIQKAEKITQTELK